MPSHPDRVRRNYHAIAVRVSEDPKCCAWSISLYVTKLQLASWANSRYMLDDMFKKFAREVVVAFGGR